MNPGLIAAYKGESGPDVLTFARSWASTTGDPLAVVTVFPGRAPIGMGRTDLEWVAWNREEAGKRLTEAKEYLADSVPAEYRAVPSSSASHGLHDAMESDSSGPMVVVGSRKTHGSVRRTAPGSTADRLLQGAPGPVAIVPWDYEKPPVEPIKKITVAFVDTSDGNAALVAAAEMAGRLGAEIDLLSVLPDTRVVPGLGEPGRFSVGQQKEFQKSIDAALGTLPAGVQATGRVLQGPVIDTLADLRPGDTDLLVCGSRGYGPARRVLLGGVSSRLLRHSRLPVVVVPRG